MQQTRSVFNTKIFPTGFFVICLLVSTFVACGIGTTNIGDIVGHPRDYVEKEITISGEVTETFSFFVVHDNSGEISVVTEKPLPMKGDKIKVKGTVKETFSFGTKTALVLVETIERSE